MGEIAALREGVSTFFVDAGARSTLWEAVATSPPARGVLFVLPRDVAIACATGMGLGGLGLGTALALHARADEPTWIVVSLLPLSLVIVGVLYLVLARARRARASDWLALGYTVAVVLATALLMLWEVARELYAEMNVAVW